MNRSRKIVIVCNCLLNANAKIRPYALCPGVDTAALGPIISQGIGLVQLPCPETSYLGMTRWGMTKEQYDTAGYRAHCRTILGPVLLEIAAYARAGYELLEVLGPEGSPSCGVTMTCYGYEGGGLEDRDEVLRQMEQARMGSGQGVFMEVLAEELERIGVTIPFRGIDEAALERDIS